MLGVVYKKRVIPQRGCIGYIGHECGVLGVYSPKLTWKLNKFLYGKDGYDSDLHWTISAVLFVSVRIQP